MQTDLFIIRTPLQYAKRELLDWKIIFKHMRNKIYTLWSYYNAIDLVDGEALYEIEEWGVILHSIVLYCMVMRGGVSSSGAFIFRVPNLHNLLGLRTEDIPTPSEPGFPYTLRFYAFPLDHFRLKSFWLSLQKSRW